MLSSLGMQHSELSIASATQSAKLQSAVEPFCPESIFISSNDFCQDQFIFIFSAQNYIIQREKRLAGGVCADPMKDSIKTVLNFEQCRCFYTTTNTVIGVVPCFKSSMAIELALLHYSIHYMQTPCTSCNDTAPCQ